MSGSASLSFQAATATLPERSGHAGPRGRRYSVVLGVRQLGREVALQDLPPPVQYHEAGRVGLRPDQLSQRFDGRLGARR